eukprot:CAMPEP_0201940342 /NCGR_PEP_ID=MMETSP0903-20130614/45070_1 /ASSEMBLY_ACC=CAM_ASM_000552 /TAXON_ID=420261 /ORGANISM="Thalassiosira antarctica, Strain CCMP982" /LENGTH=79 /DNA_ID=CAMNT_0048482133 /DNA_START=88 /DNA_END=324 /DNA_ORIENTATION=+
MTSLEYPKETEGAKLPPSCQNQKDDSKSAEEPKPKRRATKETVDTPTFFQKEDGKSDGKNHDGLGASTGATDASVKKAM